MNHSFSSTASDRAGEFRRLRELMQSASRPVSASPSSILVDDLRSMNDTFLYDIREVDSLMDDPITSLSIETADPVVISQVGSQDTVVERVSDADRGVQSSSLSTSCFIASEVPIRPVSSFGSQTSPASEALELGRLKGDLVPKLEADIAEKDSHLSRISLRCDFLVSRIMNCIACDFVIGKTQGSSTSSSFFLTVDSQSVDIFQDVDTREPMQSIPISTVLVKVSVRDATVMLLQGKTLLFAIEIRDVVRYKKLISSLRLAGSQVVLTDVPFEATGLKDISSNKPRRVTRGE